MSKFCCMFNENEIYWPASFCKLNISVTVHVTPHLPKTLCLAQCWAKCNKAVMIEQFKRVDW